MSVIVMASVIWAAASVPAAATPFQCSEDLAGRGSGSPAQFGIEIVAGVWEMREDGLWTRGGDGDLAYPLGCAESASQTMSATIRINRRTGPRGWATAGIALYQDRQNYWSLRLVESPGGKRYAELGETYRGQWQAQTAGPTALRLTDDIGQQFDWQTGQDYRFEVTVSGDGIRGRVIDAATGDLVYDRAWSFDDAPAVRSGRLALMADGLEMLVTDIEAKGDAMEVPRRPRPERRHVWVLDEALPGVDRKLVAMVARALETDGFAVKRVSADEAAETGALAVGKVDLLVLPQARRLPVMLREPLHRYLSGGGRVFAIGAPLGEEFLFRAGEKLVSRADALGAVESDKVLFDFADARLDDWEHAVAPAGEAATWRPVQGPTGRQDAVEIDVPRLDTWDTFVSRPLDRPFPEGASLTTIWAKGSERTTGMVVEWREHDGSRWIASVPLTQEWQRHMLHPDDFHYWPDAQVTGRGGPGDRFHPENAHLLSLGLAMSHASLDRGSHHYSIAGIGVAADPAGDYDVTPLLLESLSPGYKVYRVTDAFRGRARGDQAIVDDDLLLPEPQPEPAVYDPTEPTGFFEMLGLYWMPVDTMIGAGPRRRFLTGASPLSRERGLGVSGERTGRWIPLVEYDAGRGARRGTAAWLYVSFAGPYQRAAWGAFGIDDPEYLGDWWTQVGRVVTAAAHALCEGAFLRKAGVDKFAYFPGDGMTRGAQVALLNPEDNTEELIVRQWISKRGGAPVGPPASVHFFTAHGHDQTVLIESKDRHGLVPGDYEVTTELVREGRVIDRIAYAFSVLPEPRPARDKIVRTKGDQFILDGKPWYPHGVNFWPSCATGLQWADYTMHWIDPSKYDPEVVERDLDICQSLGMNALSIQLIRRGHARTVADFVERAGRRGIKCNIYLDGGHPLYMDLDRLTDLISLGHFAGNPNVWAYDVAWEPHVGQYQDRRRLDPAWKQWIIDQYGRVEEGEADWGFPVPRDEAGEVTGPSQEQILNDGDWRVMVAAYRRFIDDHISRGYNRVRRAIRGIDPDHLIGARTGWGGTGTEWADAGMPFDLRSGAKHLDFVSPEGYGMATEWERARTYGFTTAYGRWAGNGKPVFWSEFGASLFPEYDATRIETQRKIYENTYRMVLESGANGSAGWWFPGGRRLGEESDYGIVNPDGTPRASALELQKYAPTIGRRAKLPKPDRWITIDRDLHVRGYSQIMKRDMAGYLEAIDSGHFPGVRTEATGTTSADVPKVAVGNRPWTGGNPHKYLNAEFNYVRVRDANGNWVEVENGGSVEVDTRNPPTWQISIGNAGEAAWLVGLSSGRKGAVWLETRLSSGHTMGSARPGRVDRFGDLLIQSELIDHDRAHPEPLPASLTMRMMTSDGQFGEVFRVTVKPPAK